MPRTPARQAACLLALSVLCGVGLGLLHPKAPDWRALYSAPKYITTASARNLTGILWVDARTADEHARAHLPGALLLNEDNWDEALGTFVSNWSPHQVVIVYCGEGACHSSRRIATRLKADLGGADVRVLEGDWKALLPSQP